ncbi:MAG: hypothetical protein L3J39_07465 [Verrucomicrobiales bacterium]|nr:hypothetical protein [Verrucomicrobiales bacterium]
MKGDLNFEKSAKVLLALLILAFIITISGRFLPVIAPGRHAEMSLGTTFLVGIWAVLRFVVNICIGVWLWHRAKADARPAFTWLGLGVFGGLWALVAYLLIPIYEKLVINCEKREKGKSYDER